MVTAAIRLDMAAPAPLPGVSSTTDTSDDAISSATDEARARAVFGSAKVLSKQSDRTSSTRCGRRIACIAGFALILAIFFVLLSSMNGTTTAPQASPPNPPLPFSPPPDLVVSLPPPATAPPPLPLAPPPFAPLSYTVTTTVAVDASLLGNSTPAELAAALIHATATTAAVTITQSQSLGLPAGSDATAAAAALETSACAGRTGACSVTVQDTAGRRLESESPNKNPPWNPPEVRGPAPRPAPPASPATASLPPAPPAHRAQFPCVPLPATLSLDCP